MRLGADGWRSRRLIAVGTLGITGSACAVCRSCYRGYSAAGCRWITADCFLKDRSRRRKPQPLPARQPGVPYRRMNLKRIAPRAKEVEWFAFAGRVYLVERIALTIQRMAIAAPSGDMTSRAREFLEIDELSAAAKHLARSCDAPFLIGGGDAYAPVPTMPKAPVFRVVCGDDWFQVDGASGALLEKLDSSRRAYRWLYSTLHTFDVPALKARPTLRTALMSRCAHWGSHLASPACGLLANGCACTSHRCDDKLHLSRRS